MKVSVLGAGNIGTYFAAALGAKGHEVTVCSSHPERVQSVLEVVDHGGNVLLSGKIQEATDSVGRAVKGAEVVFVTYPAFMMAETAAAMEEALLEGAMVGLIPGTGGGEFAFRKSIQEKHITLFGLQRVPAVARLNTYGRQVQVEGKRERLHVAAIPASKGESAAALLKDTFDMPCDVLPNYLCVTLTPSNPILHTTRLRTLFADYMPGKVYKENPLFYEAWDDASSRLLLKCDEELQNLCKKMNGLDLTSVRSLRLHYESESPQALTGKLRSIKSLQGLYSPMKQVQGGWIPDFSSRYFTADFPYGLGILQQMAAVFQVPTPYMNETMAWYKALCPGEKGFSLGAYGMDTPKALYAFYGE